ncbi:MAG: hypothetical protein NTW96_08270 [Planctomycetia bacterium]|nr:hypothetical protein [Planctomycetia bacterium]
MPSQSASSIPVFRCDKALVGITAMPHILSMNAAGRSERAGRVGMTYGSMVKRFCTIGWALTGLIVAALVLKNGDTLADKEAAFGYACLHLLTPGLTGLMIACVLAANMSTCSNFMVNTGALFTRNVYVRLIPDAPDRRLLWVGRFSGLMLTGLGVLFALYVDQVLQAFLFTETIAALMGIMFLGGILWRRANRQGAWAATVLAFVSYYVLNYLMTCSADGHAPETLREALAGVAQRSSGAALSDYLGSGEWMLVYLWTPGPFGGAMLLGTLGLILVSILTRPEEPRRIEQFFENMRRSTDHEALPEGQPKPLAAGEGKDLVLLDLPGWLTAGRWRGFFRRYREDLVGFVLAWGVVFGLVGVAWLVLRIGQ